MPKETEKYDINKLPDFFSVRDYEQIDYSLEGMQGKKCYCFFDNGFTSNVIEPNKRDIRFVWDGFILFTDPSITLEDIKNDVNLYDSRLVALQRTSLLGEKANSDEVREYILSKLNENDIEFEIMKDKKDVSGYPSKCDLWSTRDYSVLLDAIDVVGGEGEAYYFSKSDFNFTITFDESNIKDFTYSHLGAIVLRGKDQTAIARLIQNDCNLRSYLERIVGSTKVYSYLEGKSLSGVSIGKLNMK